MVTLERLPMLHCHGNNTDPKTCIMSAGEESKPGRDGSVCDSQDAIESWPPSANIWRRVDATAGNVFLPARTADKDRQKCCYTYKRKALSTKRDSRATYRILPYSVSFREHQLRSKFGGGVKKKDKRKDMESWTKSKKKAKTEAKAKTKTKKEEEGKVPCLVRLCIADQNSYNATIKHFGHDHSPRLQRWRYIQHDLLPFRIKLKSLGNKVWPKRGLRQKSGETNFPFGSLAMVECQRGWPGVFLPINHKTRLIPSCS